MPISDSKLYLGAQACISVGLCSKCIGIFNGCQGTIPGILQSGGTIYLWESSMWYFWLFPYKSLLSSFCRYCEYFLSLASAGMNTCDLPGKDKYFAICILISLVIFPFNRSRWTRIKLFPCHLVFFRRQQWRWLWGNHLGSKRQPEGKGLVHQDIKLYIVTALNCSM